MKQRDVTMILGLILGIASTAVSYAQDPATGTVEQRDIQKLELISGKSKVLDLPAAIKRASLANPEVADTVVLSPTQLYLTGKTTGITNLTLWNESGKMMGMYDVVVAPDLTRLKENLHKTLPEEKGILHLQPRSHHTFWHGLKHQQSLPISEYCGGLCAEESHQFDAGRGRAAGHA